MDAPAISTSQLGQLGPVPAGSVGLGSGQRRMLTLLQAFQNTFSWA